MNNASSVTTCPLPTSVIFTLLKAADMYAKAARLAPKNGRLKEKAQIAQDLTILGPLLNRFFAWRHSPAECFLGFNSDV